jgi:hypothetical protein
MCNTRTLTVWEVMQVLLGFLRRPVGTVVRPLFPGRRLGEEAAMSDIRALGLVRILRRRGRSPFTGRCKVGASAHERGHEEEDASPGRRRAECEGWCLECPTSGKVWERYAPERGKHWASLGREADSVGAGLGELMVDCLNECGAGS